MILVRLSVFFVMLFVALYIGFYYFERKARYCHVVTTPLFLRTFLLGPTIQTKGIVLKFMWLNTLAIFFMNISLMIYANIPGTPIFPVPILLAVCQFYWGPLCFMETVMTFKKEKILINKHYILLIIITSLIYGYLISPYTVKVNWFLHICSTLFAIETSIVHSSKEFWRIPGHCPGWRNPTYMNYLGTVHAE